MICVTIARVIPSRRAISAWLATSTASSCRRHSAAFWSIAVLRISLVGTLRSAFFLRLGGTGLTTRLAGTSLLSRVTLLFSNAALGPKVTSTICSF